MAAAVALGALVAAAALAGSAAAVGPTAECRATLERLQGHDEVELAAMCRATFAPGVCREAKRSLGAQPWSGESMEAACGQWVAASPSQEVRRVLDTAKGHHLDKGITDKFLLPVVPMDGTTTAKPLVALAAAVPSASAPAPEKDPTPKGFLGGLFQAASTTQLGLWAKLKALKEKQEEPTTTPAAGSPLANLFKAITEKHEETTAAPPGFFAKWANAAKEKQEVQPATAAAGPLAKLPKASSEKPSRAGPPAPTIPAVQEGAAQAAAAAATAAGAAVATEGKQGQATPAPEAPGVKKDAAGAATATAATVAAVEKKESQAAPPAPTAPAVEKGAAVAAGTASAVEVKQSHAGTPAAAAAAVKKDAAPATVGAATAVEEKQGHDGAPVAAAAAVKTGAAPATAGAATSIEGKQGHVGEPATAAAAVKKDAAPATAGAAVATVADATTAVPNKPAAPIATASTMQAHRLLLLPGSGSVGTERKFEEFASKTMASTWQGAVFVSAALVAMALASFSAALVFRRGARGAQVPTDVEQPLTDALVE